MSSPITPRTNTRHASPTVEELTSPQIITPGKKIRALLSAFDNDSDSEDQHNQRRPRLEHREAAGNGSVDTAVTNSSAGRDTDDDDTDIIMPRGRMAARMQNRAIDGSTIVSAGETAFKRVSRLIHETGEGMDLHLTDKIHSSDDKREASIGKGEYRPPARARSFSPLFMSSPHSAADTDNSQKVQEDDEPQLRGNPRFRALVAQKRKEREKKEKVEAEKLTARLKRLEQLSPEVLSGEEGAGEDDPDSGSKFANQSRPTRKASKKALEEMHRETQRISRNMQLAHQIQTKKKITKESLFARFSFVQPGGQDLQAGSSLATSSEPSDAEPHRGSDTPQTSPVMAPLEKDHPYAMDTRPEIGDLPSLEERLSEAKEQPEEQKYGSTDVQHNNHPLVSRINERKTHTSVPIRVRLSRQLVAHHQKEDADGDLEVVTSPRQCRRIAVFENLPTKRAQEPTAIVRLRALAHLRSSPRRNGSMNAAELSAFLFQRAKQQAAQERQERIENLKAQGIVIETAEERTAMEDNIEDLIERARKEGEEIAKRERMASRHGEEDGEDDSDYELSGSDEEDDDGNENGGEGEDKDQDFGDEEAYAEGEADREENPKNGRGEAMSSTEAEETPVRRKRPTRIISDDENDENDSGHDLRTPATHIVKAISSMERPRFPMLPSSDGVMMSLTQAFAGTLADSQEIQTNGPAVPSTLPDPAQQCVSPLGNHQEMVKDSQEYWAGSTDLLTGYARSGSRVSESPAPRAMSQFSQIPEPTQDAGFILSPFDPTKRFMGTPASTVETVLINQGEPHGGSPHRRRLLNRRQALRPPAASKGQVSDLGMNDNAFSLMKTSKGPPSLFDKKRSKAKEVVEEAAEESDDEYAGLGGASDDSEGEEDSYDRQMINDNSGEVVDEKELAALNAAHDRATDEKQVAKLLKDINSGALRRRRALDDEFDLDDSDDERLARRREKRREFARMRQALLADDSIIQIAENPKSAAFFKAIEDHDSDDEIGLDFLREEPSQSSQGHSSQGVEPEAKQEDSIKDDASTRRKRPLGLSAEDISNRPPPHLRRKPASIMSKKPTTLAEIRETLSFLTETPEYDSFHEVASLEDEPEVDDMLEGSQPSVDDGFTRPAYHLRRTRGIIVDRLALLRQASSNSASSATLTSRLAFHTSSELNSDADFRPSLIKRVSSSTLSGTASSALLDSSRRASKPLPASGVVNRVSVNYHTAARERERERELRTKERAKGSNIARLLDKHSSNALRALGSLGESRWD